MKWCIYKHTNKINGKSYIGQTVQHLENRCGIEGKKYKKHNLYFWNAINKYGWENFDHVILEDNILTRELANEREMYYINLYRTYVGFDDCNGYNLTLGGDNREHLGFAVYQIDMKTLKPINEFPSIQMAARETSIHKNMINACCVHNSPSISGGGYYWCLKKDYSKKWKPRQKKDRTNNPLNIEVYQIDMKTLKIIKKFKSLSEASRAIKCKLYGISLCCQRKQYQCKNYFWCYATDYTLDWKPIITQPMQKDKKCVRISIKNLKDIKFYNSLSEASKENNIMFNDINECCQKKKISTKGYYWVFQEDYNENWKPLQNKLFSRVICIETKKVYASVEEASRDTGSCASKIISVCKGDRFTTNNLHWAYYEDYNENYKIRNPKSLRKVLCIETGEIYQSTLEASIAKKCDRSSILKCCKNTRKTCAGYHWKRLELE